MGAQRPGPLGQGVVGQGQRAAFAGRQVLVGVEREGARIPHRAHLAAVVDPRFDGVGGVVHQSHPVGLAQGLQGAEVGGMPRVVDGQDRPGRGVSASATAAGSRHRVTGSTSANTGRAPASTITFGAAGHVKALVTTSSPGPISRMARASCMAAVHELVVTTWRASR